MKTPKLLFGAGIVFGLIGWCLLKSSVWAENIDPLDIDAQYAWSENAGWVNGEPLGQDGPGLTVSSTAVTGYAWAENVGWINFSCGNTDNCAEVNFGVVNDASGNLSGYAWGENIGWISFSCKNTMSCSSVNYGVVIDATTGQFSGQAWSENIGWINFDSVSMFHQGIVTAWSITGCMADTEPDGDVDGIDLVEYINKYVSENNIDLVAFAKEFGTICPP